MRQLRRAQDSFNQASPVVTAFPIFAAVLLPAAAHTGFLNESKRTKANAAAAGSSSSAYSNAGVGRREAVGGARPAAAQGDAGALYCTCAGVPGPSASVDLGLSAATRAATRRHSHLVVPPALMSLLRCCWPHTHVSSLCLALCLCVSDDYYSMAESYCSGAPGAARPPQPAPQQQQPRAPAAASGARAAAGGSARRAPQQQQKQEVQWTKKAKKPPPPPPPPPSVPIAPVGGPVCALGSAWFWGFTRKGGAAQPCGQRERVGLPVCEAMQRLQYNGWASSWRKFGQQGHNTFPTQCVPLPPAHPAARPPAPPLCSRGRRGC